MLVMIGKGLSVKEISHLVGRGQKVVQEYIEIAIRYHPDLPPDNRLSKLYDGEKCPYVTFLTKYGIIDSSDKCL